MKVLAAVALASALVVPAVQAQNYREVRPERAPKTMAGINLQLGLPQGEFADFVDAGFGVGGNVTFFLDRSRRAGLRLYLSWLEYGRTTQQIPFPGLPGIDVDLTTANDIYSFGVGPEFHLSSGRVRPYVHAAIGASNFATRTSAKGTDNVDSFASTTNFNDWTFAWYGGGGIDFQVSSGRNPVYIDGGVRYQGHGRTRYLREGSVEPAPGGGIILDPVESRTDLLIIHLGVQVGI
ncbi:MAG: hypothetical protein U0133_20345 [Gemmatimonadales bacterium]